MAVKVLRQRRSWDSGCPRTAKLSENAEAKRDD